MIFCYRAINPHKLNTQSSHIFLKFFQIQETYNFIILFIILNEILSFLTQLYTSNDLHLSEFQRIKKKLKNYIFYCKSFIAFHLLSITTGIFFILPLIFTQMQFIVCTFTMGILGIWQCIIFSRFQKLQIYIYSFILSLSFLLPNTYTKAVIIGACLGLITNLQNQFTQILQFQFLQECQYFGLLLYYVLLRNIPIQSISIFTFISSSIIRLFLYDHNSEQTISKPQPLIIKQKQQYLSILGQFIIDLIFFGTLYLLYQLQNHLIIIALSLLLLASIIVNLFQNILRQLIYAILIIQIVAIIQLILIDLVVLIPVEIIIMILFVCRPINDIYLKNNLGFELYQSEHTNSLIISTISTIFAALLIF